MAELDSLQLMWPVPVVYGMSDLQFELERQRCACKQHFRGTQSDSSTYCRKLIKLDMGRHVAKLSRPSSTLALPSVVVYAVEGDSSRLCRTPPSSTCGASYREGGEIREIVSPVDSFPGYVARGFTTTCFWSIDEHFVIQSEGCTIDTPSLRGNYMIRLRAFAAEAAACWARCRDSARPAVTATSAHPREVRPL